MSNAAQDNVPKRVELHVHLDGSFRPARLMELARHSGAPVPFGATSAAELAARVQISAPRDLAHFLASLWEVLPLVVGDERALRLTTRDFVEDCRRQHGLCYVEARFCPLILADGALSADRVTRVVLEEFARAEAEDGSRLRIRTILASLRENIHMCDEVLELAQRYAAHGVVGIDVAGNEKLWAAEGEKSHDNLKAVYRRAKQLGINRTVHAGEDGPAEVVREAIEDLHAQRIGHGYRCLDDPAVYALVRYSNVHLECCPGSSWATGAFSGAPWSAHPVRRFAADDVNFSISTDDPLLTGRTLTGEYELAAGEIGLTPQQLARCNVNAARAAFLPPDERDELVAQVEASYAHKCIR